MEKMKIDYIRNLKGSYMVLTPDREMTVYEKRMLEHNQIRGLLIPFCGEQDMQKELWYDITGKQSLEMLLEQQEINQELLCRLLSAMCGIIEALDGMLLEEQCLLLEEECIFLDRETEEIQFGYCPVGEMSFMENLQRFMEYLLTKLDHKDKNAVKIAYELFEKTRKTGCSLTDIRESITASYPQEEKDAGRTESVVFREPQEGQNKTGLSLPENENKEDYFGMDKQECREKWKCVWKWKIFEKINLPWKEKKSEQRKPAQKGRKKDIALGTGRMKIGQLLRNCFGKHEQEEPFVFLPEQEEESVKTGRPTVLLSELTETKRGMLRYEGAGDEKDIKIDKDPFIIGSGAACDGYISSRAVSRQHARITQTDGVYFVEDLNSSNGTWVGGELLNYKMKISLQPNEVIVFADEKYRFL